MAADSNNRQRPRAGLLLACAIGTLLVAAGVILGMLNGTGNGPGSDAATDPLSATSSAPDPEAPPRADGQSICGLQGGSGADRATSAPETVWEYQDVTAYPTSAEFGPAETNPEGVRFCFQRSPEGALFAASNAMVQGSGPAARAWANYFLSEDTENRQELIEETGTDSDGAGSQSDSRANIAGFRILSYDGDTARIDVAIRAIYSGRSLYLSTIYDLAWEKGDWKLLPQDQSDPVRYAQIPDLTGYVTWVQ